MEKNEIKSISCNNTLAPFLRNQYFYGKLLTVRDFENEQSYHIKKQRLINKHIHGEGVVCGLLVEQDDNGKIVLKSGIALDCCGREIIVPDDEKIDLSGKGDGKYWVTISYSECGKEQVAAAINANSCEESCCFSRIEEGYKIEVLDEKPEVCSSFQADNLCKSWEPLEFKKEEEGGVPPHLPGKINKISQRLPKEFVKEYQGLCPSEMDKNKPLILATVTLSADKKISVIDNALITTAGFEKKLVHTNPKLFELLKCGGKDEEETPITIKTISWPHTKRYTLGDLNKGLKIEFSEEIECFSTNQCQQKEFSSFPEVFKVEALVAHDKTSLLSEYVIPGELMRQENSLIFKPNSDAIKYMSKIVGSNMQVRITLNGNFIRGIKTKKPVYCGMYEFKDDGTLTVPQELNHVNTSCGKFESWFYISTS